LTSLRIEIPLVPPSVNHYKRPAIIHGVRTYILTKEAKAYKAAVAIIARGDTLAPATDRERNHTRYRLTATVYLGKGQRADGDNLWKVLGDGLVEAGVIHSDAAVVDWRMTVARDRENPRTVVEIEIVRPCPK
jgi:Holliday junction resolvase RusA-like endonuclease